MKSQRFARVLVFVVSWYATCCWGQDVSPSYQHLTFLEPFIGQRQVMETKEGKTKAAGIEDAKWILSKSCVQHVGWGEFEGTPLRYGIVTGWNPKSKMVFQWGAGGNHQAYGFEQRIGTYDPAVKTWNARAEGFLSNNTKYTSNIKLKAMDEKTMTLDFTEGMENDKKMPDSHVVFSPQIDIAAPSFDESPGPGYEQLKPIEWLVGNWQIQGKWADGKAHEGEEQAEWIFNKNFIHGQGWFRDRDGKRVEYMYLIAWDPNTKKILMPIFDSGGGQSIRTGDIAPATNTITSRQTSVMGTGVEVAFEQVTRLVDQKSFEWIGSKFEGGDGLPDLKITFSRR